MIQAHEAGSNAIAGLNHARQLLERYEDLPDRIAITAAINEATFAAMSGDYEKAWATVLPTCTIGYFLGPEFYSCRLGNALDMAADLLSVAVRVERDVQCARWEREGITNELSPGVGDIRKLAGGQEKEPPTLNPAVEKLRPDAKGLLVEVRQMLEKSQADDTDVVNLILGEIQEAERLDQEGNHQESRNHIMEAENYANRLSPGNIRRIRQKLKLAGEHPTNAG